MASQDQVAGQMCEKAPYLGTSNVTRVALVVEEDVAFDPVNAGLFRADRVMTCSDRVCQIVERHPVVPPCSWALLRGSLPCRGAHGHGQRSRCQQVKERRFLLGVFRSGPGFPCLPPSRGVDGHLATSVPALTFRLPDLNGNVLGTIRISREFVDHAHTGVGVQEILLGQICEQGVDCSVMDG